MAIVKFNPLKTEDDIEDIKQNIYLHGGYKKLGRIDREYLEKLGYKTTNGR